MRKNKDASGNFNMPFYKLRAERNWSQEDMALRLGRTRQYIAQVENGVSHGTVHFWEMVQNMFHIPDSDMWTLINGKQKAVFTPPVHYICDGKKCKKCKKDICSHTDDVSHAKNFQYDGYIGYWETKELDDNNS